jgi:hypothetical protein
MEQINFSPFLLQKLYELVKILFKEDYFGFYENSEDYVNNIIDFIITIPSLKYKKTSNNIYGNHYCKYKHNYKTTWYILFDKFDYKYIINNITNNHSPDYPILFP